MGLKSAFTQGYVAEISLLNTDDNPYELMSAEYCNWQAGFIHGLTQKFGEVVCV